MENASKALLIAGGILIGIIILSVGSYLFSSAAGFGVAYKEEEAKQQITTFNTQFEIYSGIQSLSIHDVITVANLASQYNKKNGYDEGTPGAITVTVLATPPIDLEDQAKTIKEHLRTPAYDGIKLFTGGTIGYDASGRVSSISFFETDSTFATEFYAASDED